MCVQRARQKPESGVLRGDECARASRRWHRRHYRHLTKHCTPPILCSCLQVARGCALVQACTRRSVVGMSRCDGTQREGTRHGDHRLCWYSLLFSSLLFAPLRPTSPPVNTDSGSEIGVPGNSDLGGQILGSWLRNWDREIQIEGEKIQIEGEKSDREIRTGVRNRDRKIQIGVEDLLKLCG